MFRSPRKSCDDDSRIYSDSEDPTSQHLDSEAVFKSNPESPAHGSECHDDAPPSDQICPEDHTTSTGYQECQEESAQASRYAQSFIKKKPTFFSQVMHKGENLFSSSVPPEL